MSDRSLSKTERRRRQMLDALKAEGRLSIQELMERFDCSMATVRRDLEALEEAGEIVRTFGGAQYEGFSGLRELPFSAKKEILWREKQAIAGKAASLVREGDVVGLTGGTTTFLIARELKRARNITVVTNAVNIAMELADGDGVQVVLTGGVMRKNSFELCGPLAELTVPNLNIGKMFMGIDGLTAAQGVMMYSEAEARIAQLLMERSREVYAVFDHTKAGRTSLFTVAPLSAIHACITDSAPEPELADRLAAQGIAVYVPSAGG